MHNFKELKIWQKSILLAEDIYRLLIEFPEFERYGLKSQMRRSFISIPSDIAEGSARESDKDFKRFLGIALGSAFELETQLILSQKLGFIKESKYTNCVEELREIQKMIFGYKKTLSV